MSSYATLADMRVWGLPGPALEQLTTEQIQAALDEASTRADGYLADHFDLPLVPPYPVDLRGCVCRIAAYNAMSVRGYSPDGDAGQLQIRYEDAVRWLEGVASGRIHPQVEDSSGQGEGGEGGPFVVQPQQGYATDAQGFPAYTSAPPRLRGW